MESDENYAEQSADEIFSGPTHELVPSSYSSFHRHHWPHHSEEDEVEDRERRESTRSQRDSFQRSRANSDVRALSHMRSNSHGYAERNISRSSSFALADDEEEDRFQFFSRDEISHAEGASTVLGDDDSVNESFIASSEDSREQSPLPLADTDESSQLNGSSDELATGDAASGVKTGYSRSLRMQQRYYIAEEDMRIFCAGYSTVKWRLALFRLACCCTGGLLFVLGRWFPRHRLRLVAREMPLGKCEFLMIENQWGELEQVSVSQQVFNHALSTIFNLSSMEKFETAEDNHHHHRRRSTSSAGSYIDTDPNVPLLRIFTYRYVQFIYNPLHDMFFTNADWVSTSWATVESASIGLDGEVKERREKVFGKNALDIHQHSTMQLLMDEVLNPFYMFQVFSIVLWLLDDYVYYATAIFIISVLSVAEALAETRKSCSRLAVIVHASTSLEITVLRSGYWLTIPAEDLVPGDVYELNDPSLTTVPVDSVLLAGDCILNESILTGESVPVSKVNATDDAMHALVEHGLGSSKIERSVLYSGTKIIRVRKPMPTDAGHDDFQPALAMAVRTGFTTTKGALVRSMMFPKPSGFKFYRDSFRYIGVMAGVAMVGFSVSAIQFVRLGLTPSLIVLRALDIITVVVPPALPATLTIGTNFSLQRLREKGIFCITPSRVNVSGRINVVAFDKTGTLTEEGLDVLGVHLVKKTSGSPKFSSLLKTAHELEEEHDDALLDTLVTCHELKNVDGQIIGDPLDLKMFEFTGWELDEQRKRFLPPEHHNYDGREHLQVSKQFEFSSNLRRMSVIANSTNSTGMRVLVKGAPEIMRNICVPESLPANFDDVLHEYTHRGFRVIACAWKSLGDISDYDRNELEQQLTFIGLIIFENKLKPESRPVIEQLAGAGLRSVMCTGDNVLTAVSVGRECTIIPPNTQVFAGHFDNMGQLRWVCVDFPSVQLDATTLRPMSLEVAAYYVLAVTGDVFSHVVEQGSYDALHQMLVRGAVFARMSPDEKHELVSKLQQIGCTTCFCGDGVNDCGALKAADVGVSLSEAEASVAAPFTSRRFDISCVLDVLAEGRCALTTSFGCFKYMSMYSAIQFATVTILYGYGTNLGDFQFLWIDLFLIVPIAAFMAWSGPAPKLARKRPGAELVSHKVLIPLLSYMVIVVAFQIIAWRLVHQDQWWYVKPIPGDSEDLRSSDDTALFFMSSFQYIITGLVFCDGLPFRVPIRENKPFLFTIIVTIAVTVLFMAVRPESFMGRLMDLTYTPFSFTLQIIALTVANYALMEAAKRYLFSPLFRIMKRQKQRSWYKKSVEESIWRV